MTPQEGRGVQTLSQLVKDLSHLDPVGARDVIDSFDDEELAEVLAACSAAKVAQHGEVYRDIFDEIVARRLSEQSGEGVQS